MFLMQHQNDPSGNQSIGSHTDVGLGNYERKHVTHTTSCHAFIQKLRKCVGM